MKYTKTVTVPFADNLESLKIGQWFRVQTLGNMRGQYLGKTRAGVYVVRWQNESAKFTESDARANKSLRQFAKVYGSK